MGQVKYKTNIKCGGCISKVTAPLNEIAGEGKWRVDLNDSSKILFVEEGIPEARMKEALKKIGYTAERIN